MAYFWILRWQACSVQAFMPKSRDGTRLLHDKRVSMDFAPIRWHHAHLTIRESQ
jgi:hypothetical protein